MTPAGATRPRAWLWPLLRPHRRMIAAGAAAVLAQTAGRLTVPYLVKIAIDDGIVPGHAAVLGWVALTYAGLIGVQSLCGVFQTLVTARIGQQTIYAIRTGLFAHLQRLSLDFYERAGTGRVVARMTSDVEAVGELVGDGLVGLITGLVTMTGIAAILLALDWRLALAVLLVVPFLLLAAAWFRRGSAAAWKRVREAAATVTERLQESLTGVRVIQLFAAEGAAARRLAEATGAERSALRRTIVMDAMFFPGVQFCGTVATAIVLVAGGPAVLSGHLAIGTLTAFLLYLRLLFDPIQQLSGLYTTLQSATAGAERVGAVLDLEPTVRQAADPVRLAGPRGEVRLEQVRFGYPRRGGSESDPGLGLGPTVVHDASLTVPAGSTLALVGATGAGKSTIAKLIARFYDPLSGRVDLDATDLRRISLTDLRRAVTYLPQEGFLFSGTVEDNIRYGRPDATTADVEAAVRAAGVRPMIDRLPAGLDTAVGERGARLATGERQLVSLLRVWLADPAVLILDEATSGFDPAAEARMTEALRRLRSGRTTVVIAHRMSTVITADQIAVVERGRIVERGAPAELLLVNGRFAALYGTWRRGAAVRPRPAMD